MQKARTQFGDYKIFEHEPDKHDIIQTVGDILESLMDGLQEKGRSIYDCEIDSIVIVPKKPDEHRKHWSVGVKLAIDE